LSCGVDQFPVLVNKSSQFLHMMSTVRAESVIAVMRPGLMITLATKRKAKFPMMRPTYTTGRLAGEKRCWRWHRHIRRLQQEAQSPQHALLARLRMKVKEVLGGPSAHMTYLTNIIVLITKYGWDVRGAGGNSEKDAGLTG